MPLKFSNTFSSMLRSVSICPQCGKPAFNLPYTKTGSVVVQLPTLSFYSCMHYVPSHLTCSCQHLLLMIVWHHWNSQPTWILENLMMMGGLHRKSKELCVVDLHYQQHDGGVWEVPCIASFWTLHTSDIYKTQTIKCAKWFHVAIHVGCPCVIATSISSI